ncbi:hypothetical protein [Amycolatopsis sp. FDAARGOS 1241]|uniref:hypothetical protein n=1 Tax=Amycolatopsis sp. FDAARGOS 1241 TaxID=2778070 RepID=UPI00271517B7|nr:hypothetical protein [Amycolatopsis sp. FDAARGOS 1241]
MNAWSFQRLVADPLGRGDQLLAQQYPQPSHRGRHGDPVPDDVADHQADAAIGRGSASAQSPPAAKGWATPGARVAKA